MPVRDAEATRRRLLAAATADFAAHGIAGARVDRIAAEAGVNKALLYSHFGDKLGLFDAVFRMNADAVVETTPFTPEDLPDYAVRLYDAAIARPELIRLATWARLERVTPGGLVMDEAASDAKLRAIAEAQRTGFITPAMEPRDVLALVIAMALTWSCASLSYVAAPGDPDADHQRRRQALSTAVSGAFRP
ncbi:TetR family transcriptional regulator [Actinoallomurus rhizosphaericola]|uniref:TetR family transcriptional regulator n=1 Tax=Actinoallomurus rhizosphaericola TaxID=2952536 RepID=UPI00209140BC|nr:TetR family transcriptional regulator [Actinoallomurus rhizosphaericola]MCO5994515.1 TetR family transcriptional regulator [Actinoallomurus rhizosphaericola]